jgi:hypothetical protein
LRRHSSERRRKKRPRGSSLQDLGTEGVGSPLPPRVSCEVYRKGRRCMRTWKPRRSECGAHQRPRLRQGRLRRRARLSKLRSADFDSSAEIEPATSPSVRKSQEDEPPCRGWSCRVLCRLWPLDNRCTFQGAWDVAVFARPSESARARKIAGPASQTSNSRQAW